MSQIIMKALTDKKSRNKEVLTKVALQSDKNMLIWSV